MYNMRITALFIIGLVLLATIVSAQYENVDLSSSLQTGVRGRVIRKKGNFMPGMGSEMGIGGGHGSVVPVPGVEVVVLAGRVNSRAMRTASAAKSSGAFVQSVVTDEEGRYEVPLPAGRHYTIVAVFGGELYLNSFDGQMNWSTINVEEGKGFVEFDIVDDRGAAF